MCEKPIISCKSKLPQDITSHQSEWLSAKNLQIINIGKDVDKRVSSYTVSGNVIVSGNINWYRHYGRQYGDSFKNLGIKPPYDPAIPHLGIYPEEINIEKTNVSQCSLQHYLRELEYGSNLDFDQ